MYSLQQTQSIGVIAHKIVIAPYTSVTTPNDLVAILADSQITVSLQQKLMLALVTLIKEQKRHTALDEPRLMRMFSFHILPPLWLELPFRFKCHQRESRVLPFATIASQQFLKSVQFIFYDAEWQRPAIFCPFYDITTRSHKRFVWAHVKVSQDHLR